MIEPRWIPFARRFSQQWTPEGQKSSHLASRAMSLVFFVSCLLCRVFSGQAPPVDKQKQHAIGCSSLGANPRLTVYQSSNQITCLCYAKLVQPAVAVKFAIGGGWHAASPILQNLLSGGAAVFKQYNYCRPRDTAHNPHLRISISVPALGFPRVAPRSNLSAHSHCSRLLARLDSTDQRSRRPGGAAEHRGPCAGSPIPWAGGTSKI